MTTTQNTDIAAQAAQLRTEAAAHWQEKADSFERCDTDGFLSQWESGLMASRKEAEAALIERGGVQEFATLFDLDGNWVPCRIVEGKYGPSWMILDAEGKRTGEYVPYRPKRRDTLAKRGYVEGYAMFPARIDYIECGRGVTNVRVGSVRTSKDHEPPVRIISRDRFLDSTRYSSERAK